MDTTTDQSSISLASLGFLQLNDVFLLSLIRSGVDSRPELVKASGIAQRTVYRRLLILTGAQKYVPGKEFAAGYEAMVASRRHPHQQGKQLFLTEIGAELLQKISVTIDTNIVRNE